MERERPRGAAGESVQPGPDADALSMAQVEAVLRRAVQLEAEQRSPGVTGLSTEDLTRVAIEAGLSPAAIDAALSELKLGALTEEAQKQAWLDRRLGPERVRAGRVVELSPDEAARQLQHLLGEELLEPLERTGGRTVWGPQEGLRANMLRTVRRGWAGGRDWRRVEIVSDVRPLDKSGQRSIVALEARLQGRGGMAAGLGALVGGSVLGTLILAGSGIAQLAGHSPDAVPLFVASGAVATSGTIASAMALSSSAKAWQKKLRRMRASLEKLLDGMGSPG
jgi:hypothetical protein